MKFSNQGSPKMRFSRVISAFAFYLGCSSAWAIEPIIRPFLSTRSVGMGGVIMTTGLYEENFFSNPARVTANPESKLTLFDLSAETNSNTLNAISQTNGTLANILNKQAGKNLHQRMQIVLPAWYLAANDDRRFAIAFGIIAGGQSNITLSNNFNSSGALIADIGPALTFGYKVLHDESLSIGMTLHGSYRFSVNGAVSLIDLIRGSNANLSSLANEGAMYNLDLGVMYRFLQLGAWEFHAGLAGQNLLGGAFNTIPVSLAKIPSSPIQQPRSAGVGVSVVRQEWGFLSDSVIALEASDLFNNASGSFFRLLHLGLETHWKSLALRMGLNQGYWTAGLGLDVHYFTLNLASYGEELGLNAGQQEDRRYTLGMGIHF